MDDTAAAASRPCCCEHPLLLLAQSCMMLHVSQYMSLLLEGGRPPWPDLRAMQRRPLRSLEALMMAKQRFACQHPNRGHDIRHCASWNWVVSQAAYSYTRQVGTVIDRLGHACKIKFRPKLRSPQHQLQCAPVQPATAGPSH